MFAFLTCIKCDLIRMTPHMQLVLASISALQDSRVGSIMLELPPSIEVVCKYAFVEEHLVGSSPGVFELGDFTKFENGPNLCFSGSPKYKTYY